MSFFESFLGGAAQAGTNILQDQMKEEQVQRMEKIREELALDRARTINAWQQENKIAEEERAMSNSNKLREQQVSRIDGAAKSLAGNYADTTAIPKKRGEVESGIADRGNWTTEQQAAVDQSLQGDRENIVKGMAADPRVRTQAAISTGDIDPKTAATLTSNEEIQQLRRDTSIKEIEARIQNAKNKNESDMAIAELRAFIQSGEKPPSGYRFNPDGSLKAITGGPADKPVEGKALTDAQSKALLFGSRMRESEKVLDALAADGKTTSIPGSQNTRWIMALTPEKNQMLGQAKRDFMSAVLRRESGAVISDSEFESADKQYFPQIGDSAKVIAQKASNRKLAIDGILAEVPENRRDSIQPRVAAKDKTAAPPHVAGIEDELRRRGLIP